ncbi:hypothetical protein NEMBOFW57_003897 [Staphylotrichum longicolle]|uniref:Uncharacterized protein n=1 Tax=Staphylotrichum longicolle TaxID=669026 RepID=A0AAD4HZY5_9PEZI|nr:hypothetical protein NEMBOFW57_003897 [Staphylotrichum longicolle]
MSGLTYSWAHREEIDSSKFWRGWFSRAVTGGFGSWMTSASGVSSIVQWSERFARAYVPSFLSQRIVATGLSYGGRALASALCSTAAGIAVNWTEQLIYDRKDVNWYDRLGVAFRDGFFSGLLMAGVTDYWAAVKAQPRTGGMLEEVMENPGFLLGRARAVNATGASAGSGMADFGKLSAAVQNTQPSQLMHIRRGNPFKG